jgi:serine/threonine-protein kinase
VSVTPLPGNDLPAGSDGCFSSALLAAYVLGKVSPHRVEGMGAHIAACPRCTAALSSAEPAEDSLIAGLRRHAGNQRTQYSAVTRVNPPPQPRRHEDTLLGERLGPYEILEVIGRGGMGVVYRARHLALGRIVALKVGLGGPLGGVDAKTRFFTECQAVARLEHAHIVRLYEYGESHGRPYFAMEYVDGVSLAARLRQGPLEPRQAAALVQTLARAVEHAHQHQVLHRDLKPGNVLLGQDGSVKLTDFGLAKLLDSDEAQTLSNAYLGTASYMSPEQAAGQARQVSRATDVYGLGAILYEALTGTPPFRGKTVAHTLGQVCAQPPVPPSRKRPGLSPVLEAICLRCLEKAPGDRYATSADLADDLERWLQGQPTQVRPRGLVARLVRRMRHHPVRTGAALLLLGALITLFAIRYQTSPERRIDEIERQLKKGAPVVLVGEKGEPAWFRIRHGAQASHTFLAADGSFSVQSVDFCLVELLRDPQHDRYRLRAGVHHEQSFLPGEVGLFFGLHEYPFAGTTLASFGNLVFDDVRDAYYLLRDVPPEKRGVVGPIPTANPVELFPRLYCRTTDGQKLDLRMSGASANLCPPAGRDNNQWRSLEVTVTPESIQAVWEGKKIVGRVPRKKWRAHLEERLGSLRGQDPSLPPAPDFDPRGPLGLFVFYGSASFRQVIVEPLAEEDPGF